MTTATRWGILGTGSIAKQFARGLADTPNAVLQSVGSRAQDSADAFAPASRQNSISAKLAASKWAPNETSASSICGAGLAFTA